MNGNAVSNSGSQPSREELAAAAARKGAGRAGQRVRLQKASGAGSGETWNRLRLGTPVDRDVSPSTRGFHPGTAEWTTVFRSFATPELEEEVPFVATRLDYQVALPAGQHGRDRSRLTCERGEKAEAFPEEEEKDETGS